MRMTGPFLPLEGRSCGSCTLCCILPEIDVFEKPANVVCRHCQPGRGCVAYDDRPATCRDFFCHWMTRADMNEAWEPARCHMMVYTQGPQITVLVDPAFPDVWKSEPYSSQLQQWAAQAAPSGGYVIVYVGDAVTVVGAVER